MKGSALAASSTTRFHCAGGLDDVKQRGRGGHQATVERENLIRDEQGIERRATFREPYCGERKDHYRAECQKWRDEIVLHYFSLRLLML